MVNPPDNEKLETILIGTKDTNLSFLKAFLNFNIKLYLFTKLNMSLQWSSPTDDLIGFL